MPSKKAVIDIGTNTFHLLIAEVDKASNIKVIHKNTIAVKLGEGGVNKGYIAETAYKRGIDALILYREELKEFGLGYVFATATAAVRDAANGQQFIDEAFLKSGIKINLIDGLKEAEYIYNGAKGAGVLSQETSLIMDIGGGSVEFIICNQNEIFFKNSYQLGAARLLADFYHNDAAISDETVIELHRLFEKKIYDLKKAIEKHHPRELIGTAGSFDSFANIIATRKNELFDAALQRDYQFQIDQFNELLNEIIRSNHQQRENLEGLIPLRTDMVLMAAILTQYTMGIGNIEKVTTCTYSLKEGLILAETL
ncbi:exopolyphosphatase [Pedobacter sp. SD-b]|uniref:Exopolyphosphatase n=1 Tax=Pedobacter segetis TaxID=2793069 RepID=A0ABS1BL08_9SPHI|nr:exopolyphosphatase [Pedobacter segetis]MBK0383006.1 exopolyphosphatase [Pedobacter segetis]